MGKRILVTGGAGFVGRHLLKFLLDEDHHELWVIDDFSTGKDPGEWELDDFELVEHTSAFSTWRRGAEPAKQLRLIRANLLAVLASELGLMRVVGDFPALPHFDEVYHLASIVGGRKVIEGNPLLVGTDLAIDSLFFLWAATTGKCARILYASSSAAYPVNLQSADDAICLTEDMIDFEHGVLAPDLTYGWSKLTGEYLARLAVARHGLKVAVVRPFSGYGEDQDPAYPVPSIALRVAARQSPVHVWGSGNQGRDFVHISDCVTGLVGACRGIEDGSAVNLSTGVLTSFRQLAALMISLEGYDAPVAGTDNRPVGVARRYGGTEHCAKVLGWKPVVTMEAGMRRVIRHAHTRLDRGYRPGE